MKRIRILAALLAVIVMIAVAIAILPGRSDTDKNEEKVSVLVAAAEIPENTVITEQMLEYSEFPKSMVSEDTIKKMEDVVGSVTKNKISPKEILSKNNVLLSGDTSSGLAMLLDKGMRAMSISVDNVSGVSYLLKVGSHVDVILVFDDKATGTGYRSKMLLQDIEVAALDYKMTGVPQDEAGVPSYATVTLAVRPQDAVSLALGFNQGTVYLIQRPQSDDIKVSTTPVLIKDLLN